MSRAVVSWPASGRPLALWNCVAFMPSRAAVSVMRLAKAASEPEISSAKPEATSLAERATSALQALLDGDGLARSQAELGRRLGAGHFRERHRRGEREAAGLQLLEDDIDRHHLGKRGGMPEGAGIALQQGLAGRRVDHHVGAGRDRAGRRGHGRDLGAGGSHREADQAEDTKQQAQVHCRRRIGPGSIRPSPRRREVLDRCDAQGPDRSRHPPFQQNCSIVWCDETMEGHRRRSRRRLRPAAAGDRQPGHQDHQGAADPRPCRSRPPPPAPWPTITA